MKYIIAILLVSVLAITACEQARDFIPEDPIIENGDETEEEVHEEDLLPELVDEDDDVEIGEMI